MISITFDPTISYPEASEFYSPDEQFPEYKFEHIATGKNPVYRAVRECFRQANLDGEHFGQPSWNPLGGYIKKGSKVFVLANFVLHPANWETPENFQAKCINGSVLRALVDYILLAVGETGSVRFGNASMQHCVWEAVLHATGADAVQKFYQSVKAPVTATDLRLFVIQKNRLGAVTNIDRRDEEGGVSVNLGSDSLMAALDRGKGTPYRVMNYNPNRLNTFHNPGCHTYVINRHILEADVIVGLPKLKTHEKVGITCAMKGCVGAAGHKDSLPHHRFGSPIIRGDEYPSDRSGLLRLLSSFHDTVQRSSPEHQLGNALRIADKAVHLAMGSVWPVTEGAWYGNDTAWRMVIDLSRIVEYADVSGRMNEVKMRKHLALVDGIVGGEGQGPLSPDAVHSGIILFGDNTVATDYACASLMGYDHSKLQVLREAIRLTKYPLLDRPLEDEMVIYNGEESSIADLINRSQHHFVPARGWLGTL